MAAEENDRVEDGDGGAQQEQQQQQDGNRHNFNWLDIFPPDASGKTVLDTLVQKFQPYYDAHAPLTPEFVEEFTAPLGDYAEEDYLELRLSDEVTLQARTLDHNFTYDDFLNKFNIPPLRASTAFQTRFQLVKRFNEAAQQKLAIQNWKTPNSSFEEDESEEPLVSRENAKMQKWDADRWGLIHVAAWVEGPTLGPDDSSIGNNEDSGMSQDQPSDNDDAGEILEGEVPPHLHQEGAAGPTSPPSTTNHGTLEGLALPRGMGHYAEITRHQDRVTYLRNWFESEQPREYELLTKTIGLSGIEEVCENAILQNAVDKERREQAARENRDSQFRNSTGPVASCSRYLQHDDQPQASPLKRSASERLSLKLRKKKHRTEFPEDPYGPLSSPPRGPPAENPLDVGNPIGNWVEVFLSELDDDESVPEPNPDVEPPLEDSLNSSGYAPSISEETCFTQIKMYVWGEETQIEKCTFEHEPGFLFNSQLIMCDDAIIDCSQYADEGRSYWNVRVFSRRELDPMSQYEAKNGDLFFPKPVSRWDKLEKVVFLERPLPGDTTAWKLGRFKKIGEESYEMDWYACLNAFECPKHFFLPIIRGPE